MSASPSFLTLAEGHATLQAKASSPLCERVDRRVPGPLQNFPEEWSGASEQFGELLFVQSTRGPLFLQVPRQRHRDVRALAALPGGLCQCHSSHMLRDTCMGVTMSWRHSQFINHNAGMFSSSEQRRAAERHDKGGPSLTGPPFSFQAAFTIPCTEPTEIPSASAISRMLRPAAFMARTSSALARAVGLRPR